MSLLLLFIGAGTSTPPPPDETPVAFITISARAVGGVMDAMTGSGDCDIKSGSGAMLTRAGFVEHEIEATSGTITVKAVR